MYYSPLPDTLQAHLKHLCGMQPNNIHTLVKLTKSYKVYFLMFVEILKRTSVLSKTKKDVETARDLIHCSSCKGQYPRSKDDGFISGKWQVVMMVRRYGFRSGWAIILAFPGVADLSEVMEHWVGLGVIPPCIRCVSWLIQPWRYDTLCGNLQLWYSNRM